MDVHVFLHDLAVVLGVAAVTTVIFQRLGWPVVLGYLLAGLVVGPHMLPQLSADLETVQTLSELGGILLMFSVGLELRVRKLVQIAPNAGLVGFVEVGVMFFLGASVATLLGWPPTERLFAGGLIASSSTTIVVKAFDSNKVQGPQREFVLSLMVIDDLMAILLLAALAAIGAGGRLSGAELAIVLAKLAAFLFAVILLGLLVAPRLFRWIVGLGQAETTLVAAVGFCFTLALIAEHSGYSVALGAFLAGTLVAESGKEHEVARLIHPVRDLFAAIFFVSVGMLIDPALVWKARVPVLVFAPLVIVGKIAGVSIGSFLAGNGVRTSVQAGFSMAQIGEFSFVIASLGLSLGVVSEQLYPIAVAVSAITALTTPTFVKWSGRAAEIIDQRLPRPLQTFAALYASWLHKVRTTRSAEPPSKLRRLVRWLVIDAALLALTVIAGARLETAGAAWLHENLAISARVWVWVLRFAGLAVALPLLYAQQRLTFRIAQNLAARAMPLAAEGKADPGAAPRRVLTVALQFGLMLLVGGPVLALTQPSLPPFAGVLVLLIQLVVVLVGLWRSASDLNEHARAGASAIVEMLSSLQGGDEPHAEALGQMHQLLPGLGEPQPYTVAAGSLAEGRTLKELNLRGRSGATILGISRGGAQILLPAGTERLQAGDVLALAGSQEAIEAARALL
ncbi:MAG: cation:proton antiporter [Deltaproteobacteria bacterium]|nr:cation:proton antiporter [Deltaproteobacteria bacterium]